MNFSLFPRWLRFLRAYNNIWLVHFFYFIIFFPFCFRLECFCTWTNSIGKMVGWIKVQHTDTRNKEEKTRQRKTWDTAQQCIQRAPPNRQRHASKSRLWNKTSALQPNTPTFQVDCNRNRHRNETLNAYENTRKISYENPKKEYENSSVRVK